MYFRFIRIFISLIDLLKNICFVWFAQDKSLKWTFAMFKFYCFGSSLDSALTNERTHPWEMHWILAVFNWNQLGMLCSQDLYFALKNEWTFQIFIVIVIFKFISDFTFAFTILIKISYLYSPKWNGVHYSWICSMVSLTNLLHSFQTVVFPVFF